MINNGTDGSNNFAVLIPTSIHNPLASLFMSAGEFKDVNTGVSIPATFRIQIILKDWLEKGDLNPNYILNSLETCVQDGKMIGFVADQVLSVIVFQRVKD